MQKQKGQLGPSIIQQVEQALSPIKAELAQLIKKYSGELAPCKVCQGKGVRLQCETKEPLPDADLGFIPCLNCNGLGKRRV